MWLSDCGGCVFECDERFGLAFIVKSAKFIMCIWSRDTHIMMQDTGKTAFWPEFGVHLEQLIRYEILMSLSYFD